MTAEELLQVSMMELHSLQRHLTSQSSYACNHGNRSAKSSYRLVPGDNPTPRSAICDELYVEQEFATESCGGDASPANDDDLLFLEPQQRLLKVQGFATNVKHKYTKAKKLVLHNREQNGSAVNKSKSNPCTSSKTEYESTCSETSEDTSMSSSGDSPSMTSSSCSNYGLDSCSTLTVTNAPTIDFPPPSEPSYNISDPISTPEDVQHSITLVKEKISLYGLYTIQ